jgi:hypothetical protein
MWQMMRRFLVVGVVAIVTAIATWTVSRKLYSWPVTFEQTAPTIHGSGGYSFDSSDLHLLELQQAYLRDESPETRGERFAALGVALMGAQTTQFELLALLGPPDRYTRHKDHIVYAYFYDRYATKDWRFFFSVNEEGIVDQSGVNAGELSALKDWREFPSWRLSTTRPDASQQTK